MAEVQETTKADPPELYVLAGECSSKPIVASTDSDAEETPRARSLQEFDAERLLAERFKRQGQEETRERQWFQSVVPAVSWRDQPSRNKGWSCKPTWAPRDARRERVRLCPPEASTGGETKKCRVPDCQHVAVKIMPAGPRDNGEFYWRCCFCDVDL